MFNEAMNNNNNNNNNIHHSSYNSTTSFLQEDPQAMLNTTSNNFFTFSTNMNNPNSQNIGGFNPSNYSNNNNYNYNYDNNRNIDFLLHGNLGLLSPTTSEVLSSVVDGGGSGNEKRLPPLEVDVNEMAAGSGGDSGSHTPKSSISLSSTEAGGVDDESSHEKGDKKMQCNDQSGEDSKKGNNKGKKKGEKKKKEERFAFLTKSDDDHLEDGYRWRKYGQKAVKNSPYPRSYYRCTTQKCTVKKRVERSFQDPTTVITTYEGQHNHPVPATLRGHAAALLPHYSILAQPSPSSSTFTQQLLSQFGHEAASSSSFAHFSQLQQLHNNQQYARQLSIDDYGLLQDMVPPFLLKQEP